MLLATVGVLAMGRDGGASSRGICKGMEAEVRGQIAYVELCAFGFCRHRGPYV